MNFLNGGFKMVKLKFMHTKWPANHIKEYIFVYSTFFYVIRNKMLNYKITAVIIA